MGEGWRIATHGGAGSDAALADVTDEAANEARRALEEGASAIEAACRAVAFLEDEGRFNAGRSSYLRADGSTVQMDAALADSTGRFGAVACIERVRHPVHAARAVADTEHLVLAGRGANELARERGLEELEASAFTGRGGSDGASKSDTVGCVLSDGETFAAALSSGGTEGAMVGRVGDVALPGCGLRAGREGAIAATGHGESIARARVADSAYRRLAQGASPSQVVERELEPFEDASLGLIVVDDDGWAGGSNRSMAFSGLP